MPDPLRGKLERSAGLRRQLDQRHFLSADRGLNRLGIRPVPGGGHQRLLSASFRKVRIRAPSFSFSSWVDLTSSKDLLFCAKHLRAEAMAASRLNRGRSRRRGNAHSPLCVMQMLYETPISPLRIMTAVSEARLAV